MPPQKKWFDRVFDNDIQTWMYPGLVERVRGTPARVADRVRSLDRDVLTKRDGDAWSIQEHVGHLLDLEMLWLERLDDFDAGKRTLTPADLENKKTNEANHNQKDINQILEGFRRERFEIVERLDSYDEASIAKTAKHPRLQTDMSVMDLVYFIAEHDDHHLAAISTLVAKHHGAKDRSKPRGDVVRAFIDAINTHDVDTICDLASGDHVLVDPGGHIVQGIHSLRQAWGGYFAMFPDYQITVADIFDKTPWFVVLGSAQGTYAPLDAPSAKDGASTGEDHWIIPAAWLAGVRSGKISHWQVYADNDPVRRILERHHDK